VSRLGLVLGSRVSVRVSVSVSVRVRVRVGVCHRGRAVMRGFSVRV